MNAPQPFPARVPDQDNPAHEAWLHSAADYVGSQIAALANMHYRDHSVIWIDRNRPMVTMNFTSLLPNDTTLLLPYDVEQPEVNLDDHHFTGIAAHDLGVRWFNTFRSIEEANRNE